jgi:predicted metal-dependent phosphoesterase TrpH
MTSSFRADLHCHTTCSDGSLSPLEVVRLAKEVGLSGLAITDHDSIDAYPMALPLANELGIEMVTGIECSSVHNNVSVHILGYAYPVDSPVLKTFCQRHHQRRANRNRAILEQLTKHNMIVSEAEIAALQGDDIPEEHRTIGRPHIAQVMLQKGYVTSIAEAFHKYLADGKCCFVSGESVSTIETIEVIHKAGGLAMIAHPHLISNARLLRQLLELPFDGLEVYYARMHPNANQKWVRIAESKGWMMTGGSDFHGAIKPNIPLGASWSSEEAFRKLHTHFMSHQKGDK